MAVLMLGWCGRAGEMVPDIARSVLQRFGWWVRTKSSGAQGVPGMEQLQPQRLRRAEADEVALDGARSLATSLPLNATLRTVPIHQWFV